MEFGKIRPQVFVAILCATFFSTFASWLAYQMDAVEIITKLYKRYFTFIRDASQVPMREPTSAAEKILDIKFPDMLPSTEKRCSINKGAQMKIEIFASINNNRLNPVRIIPESHWVSGFSMGVPATFSATFCWSKSEVNTSPNTSRVIAATTI